MPLAGYILIEPLESEETSASGLVMPESAKDKPSKGKVLEIGPNLKQGLMEGAYDCSVKKDQVVVFKKWGGQDITEEDKELKLVKFDEIMGFYE